MNDDPYTDDDVESTYDDQMTAGYTTVDADEKHLTAEARDDDSWWDEGLVTLLLVAGVALFVFPEPATSALGLALIAVGVAFWVLDWLA